MKTILQKLMCMAVVAMVCMSVNAQTSGTCGDNATWEYDNGTLTITGTGEITTYSTDMPTAYPWYAQAGNIQTVIIGEGITNIPAWAFAMYEKLMSIHLPSTLKTIGWAALEETALWNVCLPEGLEKIDGYAFMMTPFSTVSIPSTVKEIGERAFGYCESLASVGCYAATPPTLGSNAFGDSPVETFYVASEKVGDYKAAAGWSGFGDKIQSPAGNCGPNGTDDDGDDDVTKATWAFDMTTRTLTIEGTKMGQYNRPWESAGMGGTGGGFNPDNNVGYPCGIKHVVISEGITAIPPMSFYMEVGIQTVTLPSTLTAIGMNAFGECFNIETITCDATTPPSLAAEVDPNWGLENPETYVIFGTLNDESGEPNPIETLTAIYVPTASVDNYKAASGWSTYADKIVAADNIVTGNAVDGVYWATYYNSGANMKADANTTVYKAAINGSSLTLTEIADRVINAGQAVILKSDAASIAMTTSADASAASYTDNVLEGVDVATAKADGYKYYVLSNEGATLGFYLYSGATLGANKAFVKVADTGAPEFYAFDFGGNTTGVNDVRNKTADVRDTVYNLNGQRVDKPTKGLYIVNGKLVIIK